MTEKQIEQLKNLLADSSAAYKLEQSTDELDVNILSAAHARESNHKSAPGMSLLTLIGSPLSVLSTVTLAVILTVGLFFGMSQMIIPQERSVVHGDEVDYKQAKLLKNYTKVRELVSRPEMQALQEAPSKTSRDQILLEFNASNAVEALAHNPFGLGLDRVAASNAIDIAMQEIDVMIELGSFDSARARYASLVDTCQACDLPLTLEALVLNSADTG